MTLHFSHQSLRKPSSPRGDQLHEGSEKILFASSDGESCVLHFKDESRLCPKQILPGKGAFNNRISELLFRRLEEVGISTHYVRQLNMREQLVKTAEVIPVQVEIHNSAIDDFAQRFELPVGHRFSRPILDLRFKSKELNYPIVSHSHCLALGWATNEELEDMLALSIRINDFLQGQFLASGLKLFSIKLEFGRFDWFDVFERSQVILIDEITPDNCRIWDSQREEFLDSSMLLSDPLKGAKIYQEFAQRLGIIINESSI